MENDYRIESIRTATVNRRKVKLFRVFMRNGDAYFYYDQMSAPVKTEDRDLWKIAEDRICNKEVEE